MLVTFILAWFVVAIWVIAWFFVRNWSPSSKVRTPQGAWADLAASQIEVLARRLQVIENRMVELNEVPRILQNLQCDFQNLLRRELQSPGGSLPSAPKPSEATAEVFVEENRIEAPTSQPVIGFDQNGGDMKLSPERDVAAPAKGHQKAVRMAKASDPVSTLVALWRDTPAGRLKREFSVRGFECRDWDSFILVRGSGLGDVILVFPLRDADTGSMVFRALFEAPAKTYAFRLVKPAQLSRRAWAVMDIGGQLNYLEPRKGEVERC